MWDKEVPSRLVVIIQKVIHKFTSLFLYSLCTRHIQLKNLTISNFSIRTGKSSWFHEDMKKWTDWLSYTLSLCPQTTIPIHWLFSTCFLSLWGQWESLTNANTSLKAPTHFIHSIINLTEFQTMPTPKLSCIASVRGFSCFRYAWGIWVGRVSEMLMKAFPHHNFVGLAKTVLSTRNLIIIIIIIIAFKGAIRDFLQSPHSAANCLQHIRSSGPGAIVCKSRATHRALITCKCHVTCHLVRRHSSAVKFDRAEIAFIWALLYWLNH